MRYAYPFDLTTEPEGGFTVTFPDVPEAISYGQTEAEAREMAEDALATALSLYTEDGRALPSPSSAHGRPIAVVPALAAAKLALHEAMLEAKVSNVELARRLRVDEKAVRRLLDPLHRSHIGQVEAGLRALGKRLDVTARDAA